MLAKLIVAVAVLLVVGLWVFGSLRIISIGY